MPPFVSQIEPDDAPAVIARMYDASIKERGFIYNNWKVMAHAEKVLRGYNQFITAVLNPEELSKRTLELAILKATLLNKCYYWLTHHYEAAGRADISDEEILGLPHYRNYAGFSEKERIAIAFAEELTLNPSRVAIEEEPHAVSQDTQARLKEHFSEQEIVELTLGITSFNLLNRFNRFLQPEQDVETPPEAIVALLHQQEP